MDYGVHIYIIHLELRIGDCRFRLGNGGGPLLEGAPKEQRGAVREQRGSECGPREQREQQGNMGNIELQLRTLFSVIRFIGKFCAYLRFGVISI